MTYHSEGSTDGGASPGAFAVFRAFCLREGGTAVRSNRLEKPAKKSKQTVLATITRYNDSPIPGENHRRYGRTKSSSTAVSYTTKIDKNGIILLLYR